MKIDKFSASLALGILWGVSVFILALVVHYFSYGTNLIELLSSIYIGYEASWTGGLIGLVWGFLDAFVGVYIVISLYNYFHKKFKK